MRSTWQGDAFGTANVLPLSLAFAFGYGSQAASGGSTTRSTRKRMLTVKLVHDLSGFCFVQRRSEPKRSRAVLEATGPPPMPPELHGASPVIGVPRAGRHAQVAHVSKIVFFGPAQSQDITREKRGRQVKAPAPVRLATPAESKARLPRCPTDSDDASRVHEHQ